MKRKRHRGYIAAALMMSAVMSGCSDEQSEPINDITISIRSFEHQTEESTLITVPETTISETVSETTVTSSETTVTETEVISSDTSEETTSESVTESIAAEDIVYSTNVISAVRITETEDAPSEEEENIITAQNLISSDGGAVISEAPAVTEAPETAYAAVYETTEKVQSQLFTQSSYNALNYDIQRGMWFSYLEYEDIMKNKTAPQFEEAIGKCFDDVRSLGVNTVYLQVRAFGDAYYVSDNSPKGLSMGTADFDPLDIMIKSAHDRGLSVHAWINPMRLMTEAQMSELGTEYPIGKWYSDRKNMFEYDGRMYLNPACDSAVQLICNEVSYILTHYKADGIQIDDYFYPGKDTSLDSTEYAESGTSLSLDDWRREKVSAMVKRIYESVHSANPTAVFGISPTGDAEANYSAMYADVYKWCGEKGWCDYICPQLYYGMEHGTMPFGDTLSKWKSMTCSDVKLVAGLAAYKAGTEDNWAGNGKNEWINSSDIIAKQIRFSEELGCGTALFRYGSLFMPESNASEAVNKEMENIIKEYTD